MARNRVARKLEDVARELRQVRYNLDASPKEVTSQKLWELAMTVDNIADTIHLLYGREDAA
jgi:hypothetical protein